MLVEELLCKILMHIRRDFPEWVGPRAKLSNKSLMPLHTPQAEIELYNGESKRK